MESTQEKIKDILYGPTVYCIYAEFLSGEDDTVSKNYYNIEEARAAYNQIVEVSKANHFAINFTLVGQLGIEPEVILETTKKEQE